MGSGAVKAVQQLKVQYGIDWDEYYTFYMLHFIHYIE